MLLCFQISWSFKTLFDRTPKNLVDPPMPHQSAKETSTLHTFTSQPNLLLDCLTKLKTEMVSTCYKNNFFRLGRKRLCSEKRAVFRERTSRKALRTGNVQGKISEHRFKVKSGEGGEGGYCVNYPSNIFSQHETFWKLENVTRIFFSFSWGIFSHVTRLDQSFARKMFDGL